jgi:1-aminocyclopropane-1-carboxylate deaminase/D-cysteine desulfhydrase-like pyridoxal-dependent ACC family enzyme
MDPSQALDSLPRVRLCQLPTPIQRLRRVEEALGIDHGPQLYIKRDDLTGLGLGGNKGRKLEFCLAEAQEQGADVIINSGGVQSNCARQTAIAGRALGYEVHLFLKGRRPDRLAGNLIPSALCGANLHFIDPTDPQALSPHEFARQLEAEGHRPYVIPVGASNNTGAMGYVVAAREIKAQEQELGLAFDRIFTATGSTGTQAGLIAGRELFGLVARVVGVAVSPVSDPAMRRLDIAAFATNVMHQLGATETADWPPVGSSLPTGQTRGGSPGAAVGPEDVKLLTEYAGEGYGIATPECEAAVRTLAERAGIFLDYTYTGKAMAGLIDLLKRGTFAPHDRILFLHTGGHIGLFA